jgi:hypothetical protein
MERQPLHAAGIDAGALGAPPSVLTCELCAAAQSGAFAFSLLRKRRRIELETAMVGGHARLIRGRSTPASSGYRQAQTKCQVGPQDVRAQDSFQP